MSKTTLNESMKSIFNCISFSLLQKNISTGDASYQKKSNVCTIHSHAQFVPRNNQNKKGSYNVRSLFPGIIKIRKDLTMLEARNSSPSYLFYPMNLFITPNKDYTLTKLPLCQTVPAEGKWQHLVHVLYLSKIGIRLANCSSD